jgi:hypothetical protein
MEGPLYVYDYCLWNYLQDLVAVNKEIPGITTLQTQTFAERITKTELHSLSQKKNENSIHCGCKIGMMANFWDRHRA